MVFKKVNQRSAHMNKHKNEAKRAQEGTVLAASKGKDKQKRIKKEKKADDRAAEN